MRDRGTRLEVCSQAELARYLGLSEGTISRALNGHAMVKESTRKRVLAAMEELGFRADPLARGLRGKETGLVGVLVCTELRHSILLTKLAAFDDFLHEHGLRSLLISTGQDQTQRKELGALADFRRLRVDGVVLLQSRLSATTCATELAGMTFVHVDPFAPQPGMSVSVDRNKGMEFLIDHLVALGHRTFGLLGVQEVNTWRWPGLLKGLERHGIAPERSIKVYETQEGQRFSYETGANFAEQVLADEKPPSALLAINDRVALSVAQHLKRKGASVPEAFSVTGFDHMELSEHLHPTLTTIDHEPQRLMELAGNLLLEQLSPMGLSGSPGSPVAPVGDSNTSHLIVPRLIIGESTGPASTALA